MKAWVTVGFSTRSKRQEREKSENGMQSYRGNGASGPSMAFAQHADGAVKIAILNDMSGADGGGAG